MKLFRNFLIFDIEINSLKIKLKLKNIKNIFIFNYLIFKILIITALKLIKRF